MIRQAIVRHADGQAGPQSGPADTAPAFRAHASHGLFPVVTVGDGECMIEPSVRCNHCGYCKSMGH